VAPGQSRQKRPLASAVEIERAVLSGFDRSGDTQKLELAKALNPLFKTMSTGGGKVIHPLACANQLDRLAR
jgi:hypothetical protein